MKLKVEEKAREISNTRLNEFKEVFRLYREGKLLKDFFEKEKSRIEKLEDEEKTKVVYGIILLWNISHSLFVSKIIEELEKESIIPIDSIKFRKDGTPKFGRLGKIVKKKKKNFKDKEFLLYYVSIQENENFSSLGRSSIYLTESGWKPIVMYFLNRRPNWTNLSLTELVDYVFPHEMNHINLYTKWPGYFYITEVFSKTNPIEWWIKATWNEAYAYLANIENDPFLLAKRWSAYEKHNERENPHIYALQVLNKFVGIDLRNPENMKNTMSMVKREEKNLGKNLFKITTQLIPKFVNDEWWNIISPFSFPLPKSIDIINDWIEHINKELIQIQISTLWRTYLSIIDNITKFKAFYYE